jgi:hypothetical protein
VTCSRSGSCDSYVAFASCESFLSSTYVGIAGHVGIEVIKGVVGRRESEETNDND